MKAEPESAIYSVIVHIVVDRIFEPAATFARTARQAIRALTTRRQGERTPDDRAASIPTATIASHRNV
jgi:hypothetical protein